MRSFISAPTLTVFLVVQSVLCTNSGYAAEKGDDEKSELHVVSIYEGYTKTGKEIHGPKALIKVDRPGKEVTLVLANYSPVTWEISASADTKIGRVILTGYERSAVKGFEGAEKFYAEERKYLSVPYKLGTHSFRKAVGEIHDRTKQEMRSFHGSYRSDPEQPFVVDKVQDDPRLRSDYPLPTKEELPDLSFWALHVLPTDFHRVESSYGEFTLKGPRESTLKPLPGNVAQLAYDPATKGYFGVGDRSAMKIDLVHRKAEPLKPSLDVPPFSWQRGITFDSKRGRVIFTDDSHMIAYSPSEDKWSAIAQIGPFSPIASIAYEPNDDIFYAVATERDGDGEASRCTLQRINLEGAVIKRTALGDPIFPGAVAGGRVGSQTQLIAVDKYLVMITTPMDHGRREMKWETFIFLIDPKSEKVWLTAKY